MPVTVRVPAAIALSVEQLAVPEAYQTTTGFDHQRHGGWYWDVGHHQWRDDYQTS